MTEHPFAHLRAVERALVEADEIPLVGGLPDFPWDGLRSQLQHRFGLANLEIDASKPRWIEAETVYGDAMEAIPMVCPALDGSLAWLIADADLGPLVQLLGGGPHVALLADRPLKHSFTRFLAVETIGALRALGYPHQLLPQLNGIAPVKGAALATEITLCAGSQQARSRLLLSAEFCRSARHMFAPTKPTHLSKEIARHLTIPIHVQVGSVSLTADEFRNLSVGDFVALDQSGLDPLTKEGTVLLRAAGKPFAQATAHGSQLELQELDHG